MLANRPQHFRHLQCELASRHDHQPVWLARRGRRINARHHRHTECERLARARASPAHHVFTSECNRYGFSLNGKWSRESGGRKAGIDALRHTNIGKSCWRFHFGGRHLFSHATNHRSRVAGHRSTDRRDRSEEILEIVDAALKNLYGQTFVFKPQGGAHVHR